MVGSCPYRYRTRFGRDWSPCEYPQRRYFPTTGPTLRTAKRANRDLHKAETPARQRAYVSGRLSLAQRYQGAPEPPPRCHRNSRKYRPHHPHSGRLPSRHRLRHCLLCRPLHLYSLSRRNRTSCPDRVRPAESQLWDRPGVRLQRSRRRDLRPSANHL
jgi:hypothetical protein